MKDQAQRFPLARDWTVDPKTGRTNASPKFLRLVAAVELLLRESGHSLVNGHADAVARLIVAQLAHKHGMRPR